MGGGHLQNGGGKGGFAMIDMANGTNINVRFGTLKFCHTAMYVARTMPSGRNRFVIQREKKLKKLNNKTKLFIASGIVSYLAK